MGSDIVIAIDVDAKIEKRKPEDFKSFESVITRVISLGLRVQSEQALEKADVVISPDLASISILDLDSKSLRQAIKAGEDEAEKLVPQIKKKIEQKTEALRVAKS